MTTDSDMPLASATPPVASPSPRVSTRGSTRARARIPSTVRDGKIGQMAANVASDVRGWWVLTAAPPSLADWRKATTPPEKLPDSPLLRASYRTFQWTLGLLLGGMVACALFLLAGAMAYIGHRPSRGLLFLLVSAAFVLYLIYGT